jgi:hypothetical protein
MDTLFDERHLNPEAFRAGSLSWTPSLPWEGAVALIAIAALLSVGGESEGLPA